MTCKSLVFPDKRAAANADPKASVVHALAKRHWAPAFAGATGVMVNAHIPVVPDKGAQATADPEPSVVQHEWKRHRTSAPARRETGSDRHESTLPLAIGNTPWPLHEAPCPRPHAS
jgi:hypothetical protein